jgi:hypothetical protein
MIPVRYFAVIAVAALFARADDLPYGQEGIRHLASNAELIVRATQPQQLESDPVEKRDPFRLTYSIYSIKVVEVLKGDVPKGQALTIAIARSADVSHIADLSDTFLFLRRPSPTTLAKSNIASRQDVWIVNSGKFGAVYAKSPEREKAITKRLEMNAKTALGDAAQKEKAVLEWTSNYLESGDPFLQRSALIDLYEERKSPDALNQLSKAIKSDIVTKEAKQTAIAALEARRDSQSLEILRWSVDRGQLTEPLKAAAVKAYGASPEALPQLKRWAASSDKTISSAAKLSLEGAVSKAAIQKAHEIQ